MAPQHDDEIARFLCGVLKSMRAVHRVERRERHLSTIFVFFNLMVAIICCLLMNYLGALALTLLGWFMYRHYRSALRREKLCLECIHHVQRIWVETPEMRLWHSHQLCQCFDRLNGQKVHNQKQAREKYNAS